jgi:hypothetical protein
VSYLLPFFVPAFGLLCAVMSVWALWYSTFSARRSDRPAGEPALESSAAVQATVRTCLRAKRISGIFWFCAGIATLWLSDIRDSWILPSVGLFWMAIGAWEFFSTFRPGSQAAIAAKACSDLAVASSASARRRLKRSAVLGGFSLCLGIAVVYFSGIRVGALPAAMSQPQEQNSRLAQIVTQ